MNYAHHNHQRSRTFLMLILIISSSSMRAENSLYYNIAGLYLKSFESFKQPAIHEKTLEEVIRNGEKAQIQKKELNEFEKRYIAFELLDSYESSDKDGTIEVYKQHLDESFLKKMEVLCGGEQPENSLFSKVNHTKTIFGEIALARWLSKPLTNNRALEKRQATISAIVKNPALLSQLDDALQQIKEAETHMISYFSSESKINGQLLSPLYFSPSWLSSANKSSAIMEGTTRLRQVFNTASFLEVPKIAIFSVANYLSFKLANIPVTKSDAFRNGLKSTNRLYNPFTFKEQFAEIDFVPDLSTKARTTFKAIIAGLTGVLLCVKAYNTKNLIDDELLKRDCTNYLQERLIGIAQYVDGIKKLRASLACCNDQEIVKSLEINGSESFNKLNSLLEKDTFTGQPSFFSATGRILAAHQLMLEVRNEFAPILAAAGEIDAYVSTAKLYNNFDCKCTMECRCQKDSPVRYSFAHYETESPKPLVMANAFWNPFVHPDIVVGNDIAFGNSPDHPNTAIITGPNTGGKSTVIKGILINIYLAQTLTVVPAGYLSITPFAKFHCHVNITEDVSAGASLFKSEVLRAKNLLETLKGLKKGEFSFTIMDEAFSSTAPKEGEQAAYLFTEQLGNYNNSVLLLATHFPELTTLEEKKQERFKNYQVTVIKKDDGSFMRPFKLVEGKSTINIAMDILKEEGVLQ